MPRRLSVLAIFAGLGLALAACGRPAPAPPPPSPAAPVASSPAEPMAAGPEGEARTISPEPSPEASREAASSAVDAAEVAAAAAAMKAYAEECFGEPGHSEVSKPVVNGDRAVGVVAIVGRPELAGEHALVFMKRVNGRWVGEDYGSGLEPPSWYPYW